MFLVQIIKKLETSNLTIIVSLAEVENAAHKLNEKNKVNYVLANNVGLQNLKTIRDILLNRNENPSLDIEFRPSDISSMKYAPFSSVDVERSSSRYKSVLRHIKWKIFK